MCTVILAGLDCTVYSYVHSNVNCNVYSNALCAVYVFRDIEKFNYLPLNLLSVSLSKSVIDLFYFCYRLEANSPSLGGELCLGTGTVGIFTFESLILAGNLFAWIKL